jgi:hypothetical protein
MSELFKKPSLQATVSPTGWRSIKVATQQAERPALLDLADALKVGGQAAQQFAGLQAFDFKEGVKQGQIAAASADLDEAVTKLDTIGEELDLPRSQLFGYQVGFRKHYGQREAKSNFYVGLRNRLNEVELNPENGNFNIIDQIITEEETAAVERLRQAGGSELALQGFSEFSSEIKDRFKIEATQRRDKVIQRFNENMYVEDFNQEFGERLTAASTPEDIAQLQLDLKNSMDDITANGKIPRSRVVELFWNGFAVPNVNNLLVGPNPQPDKAEKMLDSMLDIDLTGKGGKLGNINREGAQIRSKAVELRNRIEGARRSVEQDEQLKARDIIDLYMPAALAVAGGNTGDENLDALQVGAVMQFLIDAGIPQDEAGEQAAQLISSQDLNKLKILGLNYRYNDAKRDAWNAATGSILSFETSLIQKSQMVLPKAVADDVLAEIADELEDDAGADISDMLMSGMGTGAPITDPRVKAEANKLSLQAKENIWFENTDAKANYDRELSKALDAVVDVELVESFDEGLETAAERTSVKAEGRARFEEEYKNQLRSLQRSLVNDPDRDAKIIQEIPKIQTELKKRWKNFKTLELEFEEGRLKEMMQEEEPPTFPQLPKLEEAKENIDSVLNSWIEDAVINTASSLFFTGELGESLKVATKRQELKNRLLSADIRIDAKDRSLVFAQADFIESQLKTEEYKDNQDLIDGLFTLRQFYGYRNPSEIKPDDAENLDFRFTPMYESEAALLTESTQAWREITTYQKSPETLDIDEFPVYKLYNETFGINTVQQLQAFVNTQKAVLKTKNQ